VQQPVQRGHRQPDASVSVNYTVEAGKGGWLTISTGKSEAVMVVVQFECNGLQKVISPLLCGFAWAAFKCNSSDCERGGKLPCITQGDDL
jgi:hypothetical protein